MNMSDKTWTIVFICIMTIVITISVIYFLTLERKETKFINEVANEIVTITDADFNRTMTRLNSMWIELDKINIELDLLIEDAKEQTKRLDEMDISLDDLELRMDRLEERILGG